MFTNDDQVDIKQSVRITAITLYLKGLPILVNSLIAAVPKEIQNILDRLAYLLPICHEASAAFSLWERSVTDEQFQEFTSVVGETEKLLEQVDLNTLYR